MRRFGAFLTSLLVLTFSFSGWSNVCAGMSHKTASHASSQATHGEVHHDADATSHSHHTPGNGTGSDHCQQMSSCTGLTIAPVLEGQSTNREHTDRVVQIADSAPTSQTPDLEPPPPKA